MRRGDSSAWHRWNPGFLDGAEVFAALTDAVRRRGTPGFPSRVRVYTHFPFCESSCNFCMYFHQVPTQRDAHARYVDHLVAELHRFGEQTGRVAAWAAYAGGGTPTATPAPELDRYLAAFREVFDVTHDFTVEAHPRSIDRDKLAILHRRGVNRLSMGIQSLERDVLRSIARSNVPLQELADSVSYARGLGMHVSLDLVMGLPGQTMASLREDVKKLLDAGPDTVSLYPFQPVPRLRHRMPADFDVSKVFDDDGLVHAADLLGYDRDATSAPVWVGLRRRDSPALRVGYACFDHEPTQLVGFGSGAFAHVFGWGWVRNVTALETLGEGPSVYWGTRLTALDECRQILLEALASDRAVDLDELRAVTGVDVDEALGQALSGARAAGATLAGRCLRFGPVPDDRRDRLVEALLPASPPPASAPTPASFQGELVVLGSPQAGAREEGAALREWCAAVGLPSRGRRLFDGVVRDLDGDSVSFAVRGAEGALLRILVGRPGAGRSYAQTQRFTLSYAARPGQPLGDAEKQFLAQLVAATRAAEHDLLRNEHVAAPR